MLRYRPKVYANFGFGLGIGPNQNMGFGRPLAMLNIGLVPFTVFSSSQFFFFNSQVQLVPVVYSLVSTSVGHAKYVRYRNLRSE